jgi:hypothetical protein
MQVLSSHVHKKFFLMDDALSLIERCPELNLSQDIVKLAFSHAKELHVKEMDDIDKYSRMGSTEFLEFIARLGVLVYQNKPQMMLTEKIEMVLKEILKIIAEKVKYPPKTEDDELVSDFEDDILSIAKKKMREAHHEQFLIVDITKTNNNNNTASKNEIQTATVSE